MRRLGLALPLLAALGLSLWAWNSSLHAQNVGPTNQIVCNQQAQAVAVSATTTSLVTGVAGKGINICGWHVTSILSTSSTFQLEFGTGAACTTPTTLTPAFNVTSTAPSSDHIEYASFSVPAGANVCMVTGTGATGTAILLYYSQF